MFCRSSKSVISVLQIAIFVLFFFMSAAQVRADEKPMRDGIWKDPNTGLIWMRCLLGEAWTGTGCGKKTLELSWKDAIRTVKTLRFAGYSDWQVPTISQLETLRRCPLGYEKNLLIFMSRVEIPDYDKTKSVPYACADNPGARLQFDENILFKIDSINGLWSSSPDTSKPENAWNLSLYSGGILPSYKTNNKAILAVHSENAADQMQFQEMLSQVESKEVERDQEWELVRIHLRGLKRFLPKDAERSAQANKMLRETVHVGSKTISGTVIEIKDTQVKIRTDKTFCVEWNEQGACALFAPKELWLEIKDIYAPIFHSRI